MCLTLLWRRNAVTQCSGTTTHPAMHWHHCTTTPQSSDQSLFFDCSAPTQSTMQWHHNAVTMLWHHNTITLQCSDTTVQHHKAVIYPCSVIAVLQRKAQFSDTTVQQHHKEVINPCSVIVVLQRKAQCSDTTMQRHHSTATPQSSDPSLFSDCSAPTQSNSSTNRPSSLMLYFRCAVYFAAWHFKNCSHCGLHSNTFSPWLGK